MTLSKENKKAINYFFSLLERELGGIIDVKNSHRENRLKIGQKMKPLMKILPQRIKRAGKYFLSYNKNLYKVTPAEKKWALDFLEYVLKNNPEIPFDLFDQKDHYQIEQFVRNKFLLSLFDLIPRRKIFTEYDLKKQKEYEIFSKKHLVKKNKNYYQFLGFKSVINDFEKPVFIEKYGINELKDKNRLNNTTAIDCGAYIGDTVFLLNEAASFSKIIAIEPDPQNFSILLRNIKLNKINNVKLIKKGVGDIKGSVAMHLPGTAESYISIREDSKEEGIQIDTIDQIIRELGIDNVGLIKMDIEGFELNGVKGAVDTIKKFKPVLMVCLYHRGQDFFEIPELIKSIEPNYHFRFLNIYNTQPILDRILIAE